MDRIVKYLFFFIALILISCGTTSNLRSKQILISPGQTYKDVINILGTPGNKQFKNSMEAWQYCQTGLTSDLFIVIWFFEGKVTGLNSYNGNGIGNCTQFFKTINWDDGPNKTVELRIISN